MRSLLVAIDVSSHPIEVEIVLDEDELFDNPNESGYRIKVGGGATRAYKPSRELLEAMRDDADEPTRRIAIKS